MGRVMCVCNCKEEQEAQEYKNRVFEILVMEKAEEVKKLSGVVAEKDQKILALQKIVKLQQQEIDEAKKKLVAEQQFEEKTQERKAETMAQQKAPTKIVEIVAEKEAPLSDAETEASVTDTIVIPTPATPGKGKGPTVGKGKGKGPTVGKGKGKGPTPSTTKGKGKGAKGTAKTTAGEQEGGAERKKGQYFRQPKIIVDTPVKSLKWEARRVPEDSATDNIWLSLRNDHPEASFVLAIQSSFAARAPAVKPVTNKCVSKKKGPEILSAAQLQEVGCMLAKLPEPAQLSTCFRDFSGLTGEQLGRLVNAFPQADIMKKVNEALETHGMAALRKEEQWVAEAFAAVKDLHLKGKVWFAVEEFSHEMDWVAMKVRVLVDGCDFLRNDETVRAVLGSVVSVGNVLNAGDAAGERADGFGLGLLQSGLLTSVKATEGGTNGVRHVLDFAVSSVGPGRVAEVAEKSQQLLRAAAKLELKDVELELDKLGTKNRNIAKQGKELAAMAQDIALQRKCEELETKNLEVEKLRESFNEAKKAFSALREYYADDRYHDVADFFGVFQKFFHEQAGPSAKYLATARKNAASTKRSVQSRAAKVQ
ncbi:unnamed protein product [Amoebophrya sp. A120]|nr:unnamed protein product [Amoebophrya sp. A120]|eukprot:GSA120T00004176001.1